MNIRSDRKDGINAWLSDTIASVFPYVSTIDVQGNTNRVLFASSKKPDAGAFSAALDDLASENSENAQKIRGFLTGFPARLTVYEGSGRVLTDDKAPVELLGMRAIDELIAGELAVYKQMYDEQGISGLLDNVL